MVSSPNPAPVEDKVTDVPQSNEVEDSYSYYYSDNDADNLDFLE